MRPMEVMSLTQPYISPPLFYNSSPWPSFTQPVLPMLQLLLWGQAYRRHGHQEKKTVTGTIAASSKFHVTTTHWQWTWWGVCDKSKSFDHYVETDITPEFPCRVTWAEESDQRAKSASCFGDCCGFSRSFVQYCFRSPDRDCYSRSLPAIPMEFMREYYYLVSVCLSIRKNFGGVKGKLCRRLERDPQ